MRIFYLITTDYDIIKKYINTKGGDILIGGKANATIFRTKKSAQDYIEEETMPFLSIEEHQYYFASWDTHLTKIALSNGQWAVRADSGGFSHKITTTDQVLIDDAFNSDEGDTSHYDSVLGARKAIIDLINE